MRRFIIATNKQGLTIDKAKVIEMNREDIEVMFNRDCLNTISQSDYQLLLNSQYLYGVEIEFDNYLIGYRKLLNKLLSFDRELICIYDVSIKRYINHAELSYFAANKLLPSKLFNIEIETHGANTEYQTIGLQSIGLKEFKYTTDRYLNEEDFQVFKAVVTNFIIGKQAKININGRFSKFQTIESGDYIKFSYDRDPRINQFYIKEDRYIDEIRYDLIAYHWDTLLKLKSQHPQLGKYLINNAVVNDFENFDVRHVENFTIVCEDINYNQDNLFYAYRLL